MSIKAGSAFIELFLKDDKLNRSSRSFNRAMRRMGNIASGIAKSFAAIGIAAGAAAAIIATKAVAAAGDFAETTSKLEFTFGEMSDDIKKWADDVASAMGRTRGEVRNNVTDMFMFANAMGLTSEQALTLSKRAVSLAGDMESMRNVPVDEIFRRLTSSLRGSAEAASGLSADIRKENLADQLATMGLEANEANKILTRFEIIAKANAGSIGDAARTSGSFNNQMKQMRTNFEEMSVSLGQKLLPLFTDFVTVANVGLNAFREALQNLKPLEGLDEAVLKAAKSGNWKAAGEIIGLQMAIGIREAIGPDLFDAIELGLKFGPGAQFKGARQLVGGISQTAGGFGLADLAGKAGLRNPLELAGALGVSGGASREDRLKELIELTKKQLEEEKAQTDALNEQDQSRMQ